MFATTFLTIASCTISLLTAPWEATAAIDEPTACLCPKILMPVCGTDGRSYTNSCLLECAQTENSNLRVEHQGRCGRRLKKDASAMS
ncbi:hypothetical protein BV898_12465 [Hypsibius exemplaris]|uniref:Kazal-like domain-containing protein n=1 Tax=Hypsibius exemplaris TaxID=2072580 RepID=A0A1W0WDJ2_HYPEX|nr:hypothetical protein BV898_12465 [Hypsibius exemplaris]